MFQHEGGPTRPSAGHAQRVQRHGQPPHPHGPVATVVAASPFAVAVTIGLWPNSCSARWKTCGRASGRSCMSPRIATPVVVSAVLTRPVPRADGRHHRLHHGACRVGGRQAAAPEAVRLRP